MKNFKILEAEPNNQNQIEPIQCSPLVQDIK